MEINPFDIVQVGSVAALHGRQRDDALNCQVESSRFVTADIRCSVSVGFTEFSCDFRKPKKKKKKHCTFSCRMSPFNPTSRVPGGNSSFLLFSNLSF